MALKLSRDSDSRAVLREQLAHLAALQLLGQQPLHDQWRCRPAKGSPEYRRLAAAAYRLVRSCCPAAL
jgi:hypothetical protein